MTKVGTKFKLSKAPEKWKARIKEKLCQDREWLLRGGHPWDAFYLNEKGILQFFPKKRYPKWERPKDPVIHFEGRKYMELNALYYEITFLVIADEELQKCYRQYPPTQGDAGRYLVDDKWCYIRTKRQVNGKLQTKLREYVKCLNRQ